LAALAGKIINANIKSSNDTEPDRYLLYELFNLSTPFKKFVLCILHSSFKFSRHEINPNINDKFAGGLKAGR